LDGPRIEKSVEMPVLQQEYLAQAKYSLLSENALGLFSEIDAFLAHARNPRSSENASDRLSLFFYILSLSPSARHKKRSNLRKLG